MSTWYVSSWEHLPSPATTVVLISLSPSLLSSASSCFTSSSLAQFFLNNCMSGLLFCFVSSSWFLKMIASLGFFFFFSMHDNTLSPKFHLFCDNICLVNLFPLFFICCSCFFHLLSCIGSVLIPFWLLILKWGEAFWISSLQKMYVRREPGFILS